MCQTPLYASKTAPTRVSSCSCNRAECTRKAIAQVNHVSSTPSFFCRIAAIAAILVSGVGKTVHQQQHCNGNCGDVSCQVAPAEVRSCPFGCQSCRIAGKPAAEESDRSPKPSHDEHQCSVCQVLAQAPEIAGIIETPQLSEFVRIPPEASRKSPCTGGLLTVCSRGPPAAEACLPAA
jgi:hypothetical protein